MSIQSLLPVALLAVIALSAPAIAEPAGIRTVEAEGSQFKVTLADGRVLRSPDLVGAVLTLAVAGQERHLRIDAVETDPGDHARGIAPSPAVYLHTLSVQAPDGHWENICDPGPDGRREAFPIAGRVRADATIWPDEKQAFELTCTGGAQGKCVRFGYHPWQDLGSVPPYDLYNACVRMVRADYAGDGRGTTRNGMLIDFYDDEGIQPDAVPSNMPFEAGWTKDGAVCVRHVRVRENTSLEALAQFPSLDGRLGEMCTAEFARTHGAVLFNRSRP